MRDHLAECRDETPAAFDQAEEGTFCTATVRRRRRTLRTYTRAGIAEKGSERGDYAITTSSEKKRAKDGEEIGHEWKKR